MTRSLAQAEKDCGTPGRGKRTACTRGEEEKGRSTRYVGLYLLKKNQSLSHRPSMNFS